MLKRYRTITLPNGPANVICPCASSVLCASNIVNVIDSDSELSSTTYTASTTSVHTLIVDPAETDSSQKFLTAAEYNPVINVFREGTSTMIGMLRSENEVLRADLWSRSQRILPNKEGRELSQRLLHPQELLVALNKDGVLELFPSPFDFDTVPSTGMSVSREAKKGRSRKSVAQVQVIRPDKGSASVPLINASFQDDNLVLAWAEGGVGVAFHMVPWRDEETGKLLLHGRTQIEKARSASGIGGTITNGVKDMSRVQVNDSHAVVANGAESDDASSEDEQPEMIEISSGEEESEFEEDGEPPRRLHTEEHDTPQSKNELDGATSEDIIMEDTQAIGKANEQISEDELEAAGESNEDAEPPTFGDLIRANAPSAIDVPNTPREDATQSLGRIGTTSIQAIPQGMSLGTVLTQALRTNDISLLESCIHTRDLSSVRATIERLESTFASTLLQRLAERLHSRPGRAGTLMVWIQWTLVAHGGYLASQPEVMSKLRSLHQVVRDRASSLPNLLSLKGKLDMLEAQMNLRKRSAQRWDRRAHEDEDDDAEEEAVIYVEGQEDREVNKIAEDEDDDLEDLEDDEDGDDSAEGDEEEEDEEGDPEGDEEDEEDDDDDLEEEERGIEVETIPNPKPKSATKPPKIHPASIPNGTSSPPLSPIEATSDDSSSASDDEVDEANEVLIDDEASSTGSSRSGSPQSSSEDNSSSEDDEDIDHESVDSEGSSIGEDEEEEGAAASSSSSAASPPAKKVKVRKSR